MRISDWSSDVCSSDLKVDYDELLEVFWECHDPTQVNRQGTDIGSQYRSAIFTFDAEQDAVARESRHGQDASGRYARPVATEITSAGAFVRAGEPPPRNLATRPGPSRGGGVGVTAAPSCAALQQGGGRRAPLETRK